MPSGWYDPPDPHECDSGDDCTCEQDAQDAFEQSQIDREEARRDDDGYDERWMP